VFSLAVLWTVFHHPHLSIPLNDVGLHFAHFFVQKFRPIGLTARDSLASFLHTLRTQGICLSRPTQDRLSFLPGLQKRLFRPFWSERRIRIEPIEVLNSVKSHPSPIANGCVDILHHPFAELCFDLAASGVVRLRGIDQSFQTRQGTSLTMWRDL